MEINKVYKVVGMMNEEMEDELRKLISFPLCTANNNY